MKGQASPEFLVAMMIFLGASIFVITSVMRNYYLASGEYYGDYVDLSSEKLGRFFLMDSGEDGWMENPSAAKSIGTDNLNPDALQKMSGLSYPEMKRLLRTSDDFRIEIKYLPSYVLFADHTSQYLTGWVNITLQVRDYKGQPVQPANITAALIGPETALAEVTQKGNRYNLGFYVSEGGTYSLSIAAIDGNSFGQHRSRLEVIS